MRNIIIFTLIAVIVLGAIVLLVAFPKNNEPVVTPDPDNGDSCVCTMQYNPVCGADGKTYGNSCMASCAKVTVVSAGECPVPTPIPPAPTSTPSSTPEPDSCVCTMQYDPVCGADGKTYGNACVASCAKVTVVSAGECP